MLIRGWEKPDRAGPGRRGYRSRRIIEEQRLVYKAAGDETRIALSRYHYESLFRVPQGLEGTVTRVQRPGRPRAVWADATTQNEAVQRAFGILILYRINQEMMARRIQPRITQAVIFDEAHQ